MNLKDLTKKDLRRAHKIFGAVESSTKARTGWRTSQIFILPYEPESFIVLVDQDGDCIYICAKLLGLAISHLPKEEKKKLYKSLK